jgi:hypothetical protein
MTVEAAMAGPTYRIEPCGGRWSVLAGGRPIADRDFASLDEALAWCARHEPAAIRLPDAFVPSETGPGFEVSTGHTRREG